MSTGYGITQIKVVKIFPGRDERTYIQKFIFSETIGNEVIAFVRICFLLEKIGTEKYNAGRKKHTNNNLDFFFCFLPFKKQRIELDTHNKETKKKRGGPCSFLFFLFCSSSILACKFGATNSLRSLLCCHTTTK